MSAQLKIQNAQIDETETSDSAGFQLITPQQAMQWLETRKFDRQRKVIQSRVNRYADLMRRGLWRKGDGRILFGQRGERIVLMNGQHRLHAVVQSGVSVCMEVCIRRYPNDTEIDHDYAVMDQLAMRTTTQGMAVLGTSDAIGIPPGYLKVFGSAVYLIANGFHRRKNTPDLCNTAQERDEALRDYGGPALGYFRGIAGARSNDHARLLRAPVTAIGLLAYKHQPDRADDFWPLVALNDGLRRGEAAHVLVQFLVNNDLRAHRPESYARAVARCWNAFYDTRSLTQTTTVQGEIIVNGTPFNGQEVLQYRFESGDAIYARGQAKGGTQ